MGGSVKEITLVGFGRVGRALAFLLSTNSEKIRLNVLDPHINLGAYEDMSHAYQGRGHSIVLNDRELAERGDVVFHCAGPSVPKGSSRLSIAEASLNLTREIFEPLDLTRHNPLLVVIANPVDLVSLEAWRVSGLPAEKVVGTGTLLDTLRYNCLIERNTELADGDCRAILLGEHGSSMMVWLEGSTALGRPLLEFLSRERVEELLEETRHLAALIKRYQGATYYGVAYCAVGIWRKYEANEEYMIPASVCIPADHPLGWGGQPCFMSLPALLGYKKVRLAPVNFNEEDLAILKASSQTLREAWLKHRPPT